MAPKTKPLKALKIILDLIKAKPAPNCLLALYLSIRWRCYVPLSTNIYYPANIRIGSKTKFIGRTTLLANGKIDIGSNVEVYEGAFIHCQGGTVTIADNTAIGPYVIIYGGGDVYIGKYCSIATHTSIISTSHSFSKTGMLIREQGCAGLRVCIEDDVWIGANCSILYGINLQKGCIVGANSMVNRDVHAYSIAGGSPIRMIKKRIGP